MRSCVGVAVAALVATGCGGGDTGIDGAVTHRAVDEGTGGDLACAKCIVTGAGLNDAGGIGWEVSAIPLFGPDAGPGFGGHGIAATGSVRLLEPATGIGLCGYADYHVDTILGCTRYADGTVRAFVSGAPGPHTDRFFLAVSDAGAGADLAFHAGPASGAPPADGTVATLTLPVHPEDLHVDKLDRCEFACPAGQCVCPETGACEPCHGGTASPGAAPPPPDVTAPGGDPTAPAPGGTPPPPPDVGTPPPGPFIPL
jgi:hypothetical protein